MLRVRVPHNLVRETTHVQELAYAAIDRVRQRLSMLAVIDGYSSYGIWAFMDANDSRQLSRAIEDKSEAWKKIVPKNIEKMVLRVCNDYVAVVREVRALTKRKWTLKHDIERYAKELMAALDEQLGLAVPDYPIKLGIFPKDIVERSTGITDPEKKEIRLRIELANGILSLWRRKYVVAHELVHAACMRYSRLQAPWFVEGMAVFYGLRVLSSIDSRASVIHSDLINEMPSEYQNGYNRIQLLESMCGNGFIRRLARLRSPTIHDRVYDTILYFSEILPEESIKSIVKWCESRPRACEKIVLMNALDAVQMRVLAFLVRKYKGKLVRLRRRFYVNNAAKYLAMKKGEVQAAIAWLAKLKLIEWTD